MKEYLARVVRLAASTLIHFYRDGGFHHCASVSYYSVLSLGPFLYLLGFTLHELLPGFARDAVRLYAQYLPPDTAAVVEQIGVSLEAAKGLLVFAVPSLLWVASAAFLSLEFGVNVAFDTVPRRRFWLSRLKASAGAVTMVLLLVIFLVARHLASLVQAQAQALGLSSIPGARELRLTAAVYPAVSFLAFFFFYKVLPRGRVRWSSAAGSALFSVLLWEAARRTFGGMILRSHAYGLATGTLAGVVAFLLWVYAGVAVTLLGAELCALLNGNRRVVARTA